MERKIPSIYIHKTTNHPSPIVKWRPGVFKSEEERQKIHFEIDKATAVHHSSACRVQCWYRCFLAKRRVSTVRVLTWCLNKNALKVQSAWRCSCARVVYHRKLAQREVFVQKRAAQKEAKESEWLVTLIHWHRAACEAAALRIQLWFRKYSGLARRLLLLADGGQLHEGNGAALDEEQILMLEQRRRGARFFRAIVQAKRSANVVVSDDEKRIADEKLDLQKQGTENGDLRRKSEVDLTKNQYQRELELLNSACRSNVF